MRLMALALALTALLGGCCRRNGGNRPIAGYSQSFGTYVANAGVNTFCLSPKLRLAIWSFEWHFGRKIVVSSGYRDPSHNARVGGAGQQLPYEVHGGRLLHPRRRQEPPHRLRHARTIWWAGSAAIRAADFIHIDVRDRPRAGGSR